MRVHGEIPGCTDLGGVHPVNAHNKTLISDTARLILNPKELFSKPLLNKYSYVTGRLPGKDWHLF